MNLEDVNSNKGRQSQVYESLRGLLSKGNSGRIDFGEFKLLCNYANPSTSWSNSEISNMVSSHLQEAIEQHPEHLDQLIGEVETEAKVIRQRQQNSSQKRRFKGLNPKLGYDETNYVPLELVPYIWILIEYYSVHKNWHLLTATIMNIIDLPDMEMKISGTKLLQKLVQGPEISLSNTGLVDVFINILKNNLYLSNMELFELSFDVLNVLNKDTEDSDQAMVELLNVVLMMTDRSFNRYGESQPELRSYLGMLAQMVQQLDFKILISLNRVNFLINQMMTNTSILELHAEILPVILQVQKEIFEIFNKETGKEGKWLLYEYRFDILAAWKITTARLQKLDKSVDLQPNISQFQKLISDLNQTFELQVS